MRFLTLNCHAWHEENQLEKIKNLARVIKKNAYDVITLQEVSQSKDSEQMFKDIKKDNYVFLLVEELGKLGVYDYSFFWEYNHISSGKYEEGTAILTKHPVGKIETSFLSISEDYSNWKTRKSVKNIIEYKNKEIAIFCCHLGFWDDSEEPFKQQADRLLEQVKENELTFLMGDFNSDALKRNTGYDYLMSKGLYDTYNMAKEKDLGITVSGKIAGWEKNDEQKRIDLILTNTPVEVKYSRVIFNGENESIVSDHYGLEVEIEI
ncbi:endonuclease/exonuclease/phosphatase family protein [Clostridium cellulovorans]|uniref:Endonuclease/exonuclease/phosphatase n=1 Tax=Clostridium cellulovorans (strain ATCC 35296 / DSM 3052 / OCM 3 / 743B) TaxID=573061 RepID=D9SST1_CLOC7|nr:endonuclease/exonuclease/phosphatase family protein [Clostridium cellulovorans]ADL52593.1 Endonuclease/exonuclease/phosphatase [Clostridium cellulovorans 743B]